MNKKLLIAETLNFSDNAIEIVSSVANVVKKDIKLTELDWAFRKFDYFWFRLGFQITEELLRHPHRRVSVIICPVTGLDHIDIQTCKELDIKVISLKGEVEFLKDVRATAELTIGLTLALLRKILPAIKSVQSNIWNRDLFKGCEIQGKQVGIIGMGRLGKIVADLFLSFGAKVSAYDIKNFKHNNVKEILSISKLLKQSDIISVHVNYNEKNKHMFNSQMFSLFKNSCIFINTSRGALVDSHSLINALKKGVLSGAALDVIEDEYNPSKSPLIEYSKTHDNLIITPHIGGNTEESLNKTEIFSANKLRDYINEIR